MNTITILGIAVSLAMDAFAVSVVAGATIRPLTYRHVFRLSWHFGLFQFLMPVLGWLAGNTIIGYMENIDHWIAFGLLSLIGGKMIYESFQVTEQFDRDISRGWSLLALSVATSIDALAIGLTLSVIQIRIMYPSVIIGIVAMLFSILGIYLGRKTEQVFGKKFELFSGLILILIGLRILITHL
ncbi:MAG: manganese efflux pump MntP family protein [Candidatus Neomarinimicrobiota bacterium]